MRGGKKVMEYHWKDSMMQMQKLTIFNVFLNDNIRNNINRAHLSRHILYKKIKERKNEDLIGGIG